MKRQTSVALTLLAAGAMVLAATGCGQKGPLVPASQAGAKPASAPAASAPRTR